MAQHVAIHDAILKADAPAARRAAEAHIDFIVETTRKAEQTGEWNRISRLRLLQRDAGT
jgi:GntR family transcriptional repressor for pyruvate dehydrogenase complex